MAKVVVGFGIVRLDGECRLIDPDRLVMALQGRERHGKMLVGLGGSALDLERTAEKIGRSAETRLLEPYKAKAIERFVVTVVGGEYVLVASLRVGEAALTMEQDGFAE